MRSKSCKHDFKLEVGNAGDIQVRCQQCFAFYDPAVDGDFPKDRVVPPFVWYVIGFIVSQIIIWSIFGYMYIHGPTPI